LQKGSIINLQEENACDDASDEQSRRHYIRQGEWIFLEELAVSEDIWELLGW